MKFPDEINRREGQHPIRQMEAFIALGPLAGFSSNVAVILLLRSVFWLPGIGSDTSLAITRQLSWRSGVNATSTGGMGCWCTCIIAVCLTLRKVANRQICIAQPAGQRPHITYTTLLQAVTCQACAAVLERSAYIRQVSEIRH